MKEKGIPTYGTYQERKDRLKKHHGISNKENSNPKPVANVNNSIKKIEENREKRRKQAEEAKAFKQELKIQHEAQGRNIDVDFDLLMSESRI